MTFDPTKVKDFLEIFNESKQLIRNMKGCSHLELLNDINSNNIFFTYSYWDTEDDLDDYRKSEVFEQVWNKTKILFIEKPEAWSVEQKMKL